MVRKRFLAVTLGVTLWLLPSLSAWNSTGHRVIAAIAYDNLTAAARTRVDSLIRQHPDYEAIFATDAPADPNARARAAFIAASVWPDLIRNDRRFYDELRTDGQPTPLLPGFPEMGRHTTWHYVDFNYSDDGTPVPPLETPNALGEVTRMVGIISGGATAESLATYCLPWIEHILADIQQPLHTVSRYSSTLPKGDRGGNEAWVLPTESQAGLTAEGGRVSALNLHAYWDGLMGNDDSLENVNRLATELTREYRSKYPTVVEDTHPETWVVESFYNARNAAYRFSFENGTKDQPIPLQRSYERMAQSLARDRVAVAGMRLAAVLNEQLR